jgi:translation initiation factor 3 subunit E
MLQARQELLGETYMVDFAIDIYTALHESEEVPKEMVEKRLQVLEMLERQDEVIKPVRDIISNPEVQEHLDSGRQDPAQFENILAQNGFKPEMIDTLYEYSKLQYDCGLYQQASDYLYFYKTVAPPDNKHADSALWGKLSSEILLQNWDTALEDLLALRRRIEEANKQSPLVVLQQRTWLIHWSLYVYFNHEKGPEDIINFFLYEQQ